MLDGEDPYGNAKRLAFCARAISASTPRSVLDVGCGTGERLTRPLAERFPHIRFTGIDSDADSIAYARSGPSLPNLNFCRQSLPSDVEHFDLIIVSEVVEHVESPEDFLGGLQGRLKTSSLMIVTLPNGFGPFEFAALIEALLRWTGLFGALRRIKRALVGAAQQMPSTIDTLAASPHVNFFTRRQIESAFARAGLGVQRFQARTFLCGFGFDSFVTHFRLSHWNAHIADRVPPALVSAWMYVLAPCAPADAPRYRRGWIARLRRSLNQRVSGPR